VKTIDVGAFHAKTHLSQLLDEVEGGAEVRISRRGKPVAVLRQDDAVSKKKALQALTELRKLRKSSASVDEIIGYRDGGRER